MLLERVAVQQVFEVFDEAFDARLGQTELVAQRGVHFLGEMLVQVVQHVLGQGATQGLQTFLQLQQIAFVHADGLDRFQRLDAQSIASQLDGHDVVGCSDVAFVLGRVARYTDCGFFEGCDGDRLLGDVRAGDVQLLQQFFGSVMLGYLQRVQIHDVQILTFEHVVAFYAFGGGTGPVRTLVCPDGVCFFDQIVGHCDELLSDLTVDALDEEANFVVRIVRTAGLLFRRPAPYKLGAVSDLPVLALHPEVVVWTFQIHVRTFLLRCFAYRLRLTGWFFTTNRLWRRWALTGVGKGRTRWRLSTVSLILLTIEYRTTTTYIATCEHAVAGALFTRLATVKRATALTIGITAIKYTAARTTATTPATGSRALVTATTAGIARQTIENVVPFGICTLHFGVDVVWDGIRQLAIRQTEGTAVRIDASHDDIADARFFLTGGTATTQLVFGDDCDHLHDVGHFVVVPVALGHVVCVGFTQFIVRRAVLDVIDRAIVDEVDEIVTHDDSSWILNALNKTLYTV
ncbi:hypothetical protein D3C85_456160 [compost metagenome]